MTRFNSSVATVLPHLLLRGFQRTLLAFSFEDENVS